MLNAKRINCDRVRVNIFQLYLLKGFFDLKLNLKHILFMEK